MMTEDLSGMPVHEEIRDTLRAMIRRGLDPLEVAEAAQVVATALSVSVEGEARAGAKIYAAGAAIMKAAEKPPQSQHAD
ncbi:hypothetical protein MEX01_28420 [Methylorubrum extorquens]|uniref:hypothetical protein n=1 Tax=Methylorubrum extorquens TaxID=408 RepID=UPI0011690BA7|nr:hypothetical protein [Methylorubrum extorquens]GEL42251.1 hypothetical protein MEX01_28420 [Methylorubrum extorquens]